jgi:hypothetical protein
LAEFALLAWVTHPDRADPAVSVLIV